MRNKKAKTWVQLFFSFCFLLGLYIVNFNSTDYVAKPVPFDDFSIEPDLEEKDFLYVQNITIKANSSFYETMRKANINPNTIYSLTKATDLSQLKPGVDIKIHRSLTTDEIKAVHIVLSKVSEIVIEPTKDGWQATPKDKPIKRITVAFSGEIDGSLWDSADQAGLDGQVILNLAEVFAWQIDFDREVRPKDKWYLVIEKLFVDNHFYSWGNILIAHYKSRFQKEEHTAVRYQLKNKKVGYYNLKGENMKSQFLKSPIRFGRISSRFQRKRFHPILKIHRPHLGVDYAAPTGTPIRAVGDGVVTYKGYGKASGRTIKIRHNSVYKTAYKHMSSYANNTQKGKRVKQGQVIGYVGSSGLATGPHLHFEFFERGKFVDPLGRKFPRAKPIPQKEFNSFAAVSKELYQKFTDAFPGVPLVATIAPAENTQKM